MVNFKINNLSFCYSNETSPALKSINLEINQGEFVVLCGKSGSGKSTLLRMLKPELTPKGKKDGEIFFFSQSREAFSQKSSAESIGFMLQNIEYQTVTHTVRSELAFALENLGLESKTIRLRIAEICAYFSLEPIIDKKICELSGGQKQTVCLAAIMAIHPKAIILDEPTSQLDPVSASNFLDTVQRLCKENAITVIISEHRLQNVIPIADRVIIMQDGEIINDSEPKNINREIIENNDFVNCSLPFAMSLYFTLNLKGEIPLSVAAGKRLLSEALTDEPQYKVPERERVEDKKDIAVEMKNVRFAYDEKGYVIKNMNIKIKSGSFTALMGANGAGKTTALSLMGGILPCKIGKIKLFDKDIRKYKSSTLYGSTVAFLPQKCESLFAGNTVKEDLESVLNNSGMSKDEIEHKINKAAVFTEITHLLLKHPYDISGGEMQRAALAMVMLKEPKIIFLDEPTKGMDNLFKKQFAKKIREMCQKGVTVVMVSHDTEFCAEYCDECAMIFDGMCVLKENKYDFFAQNYFYTTTANKISREIFDSAITGKQVIDLCKKNLQNSL